jgi:hypothetical protein
MAIEVTDDSKEYTAYPSEESIGTPVGVNAV